MIVTWRWVLGLAVGVPYAVSAADPHISFEDALSAAERNTPALSAASARRTSARHLLSTAGELPDPKLVLGFDNMPITGENSGSLRRDAMTMQRVGISQDLPNQGKRRARVALAEAQLEGAKFGIHSERLIVRRDAALAWLAARFSAARLALQDDLAHENQLFARSVAARLASGAAASPDTLLPAQEALRLADQRDDLLAALAQAEAEMTRALGMQVRVLPDAELPHFEIDPGALRTHLAHHPELRAFEARVAAAGAVLREAEAARRPDWNVELAYQHRGPRYGEMISAQVMVDLPMFAARRQEPMIAARAADLAAIDDELSDARRAHAAELERMLADYARRISQRERLERSALPLARQRLDLAYRAYAAGTGSLLDVLAARRTLAETRFKRLDLEAELARAAARLHFSYEESDHE